MSSIEWAKNNPDEYEKWKKKKVRCNDCDSIISNGYRKQHEKSKKHLKSIGQLDQCIVIPKKQTNKQTKEKTYKYCEACDRQILDRGKNWESHIKSSGCIGTTRMWNEGFIGYSSNNYGGMDYVEVPPKVRRNEYYKYKKPLN